MRLSENLTKILKERKLTVAALAKGSGVPKTNIHGWISDNSSPNLIQLEKVASYLGVSIEYLAFGRQEKTLFEELIEKLEIHNGLYEVSIKKVTKK